MTNVLHLTEIADSSVWVVTKTWNWYHSTLATQPKRLWELSNPITLVSLRAIMLIVLEIN